MRQIQAKSTSEKDKLTIMRQKMYAATRNAQKRLKRREEKINCQKKT